MDFQNSMMALIENNTCCETISCAPMQSMDKEDLCECIHAMIKQETHYLCHDYLRVKGNKDAKRSLAFTFRPKMCQWILHTLDCAGIPTCETAIVAMSFLDRFLCCSSYSTRARRAINDMREYQLVAITSVYIAVKVRESAKNMSASTWSQISRLYSVQEITACERDLLATLGWRLNGRTPFQFISYILELLPDSERSTVAPRLWQESRRQVELTIEDYGFVPVRSSCLAVASVLNSLDGIPQEVFSSDKRVKFTQEVLAAFGVKSDSPMIKIVRNRLLEKAAKSSSAPEEVREVPSVSPAEKRIVNTGLPCQGSKKRRMARRVSSDPLEELNR